MSERQNTDSVEQQVFILAAGPDRPWAAAYPPQLADIGGEPLIVRTLRQLREHGRGAVSAVVVTDKPVITELVRDLAEIFDPGPIKRWKVETMTSTEPLWDAQRIVFLLGDVVFSDEAIAAILAERGEMHLYAARRGEGFAFTFDTAKTAFVKMHLGLALEHALHHKGRGCLWNFYYSLCGWRGDDLHSHHWDDRIWREVADYTADLDKVSQLEAFWKCNPWSAPKGRRE